MMNLYIKLESLKNINTIIINRERLVNLGTVNLRTVNLGTLNLRTVNLGTVNLRTVNLTF